jgi:pyruvate dehydrogenase E2 component (dihydrolipoamide acetyltransferase)
VVVEDGMFAIRSLMTATLSADHRVVDGAIGARFLHQVKKLLESPQL